jgi:hypothetical protein
MRLMTPRILVLDSATLGKAARDYWSREASLRAKVRTFITRLTGHGIYIALTFTHVCELLRHNDERIVRDRLSFLRALPLIAWLRPYDRSWFPGGAPDLLRRELHAVVHADKREWRDIVQYVRMDLWETGTGSEMFVDDDDLWFTLREELLRRHPKEFYVASVLRTDPGRIHDLTVGESASLPRRSKEERRAYMPRFAAALKAQLERHGDRRLESGQAAIAFSNSMIRDVQRFEEQGGDLIVRILEHYDVPRELVTPDMTVLDVGALAAYIAQLKLFCRAMRPPVTVSVRDVPPDALPSYVVEHRLAAIQRQAARVSGSDFGDGHIAPLTLYADGVEVDKRTCEYLTRVQRADGRLKALMHPFFRSADYAEMPGRLEGAV